MFAVLQIFTTLISSVGFTNDKADLPWEKDYATAFAKAQEEKRPLFVMMTATWCGPCKQLESTTLVQKDIRAGLKEFVWVQAFEDKTIEQKYGCNGYPTLAFIDPEKDKVLHKSVGYKPVGPFLKTVIDSRKAVSLPLSERLEELAAKAFTPDPVILNELINNGDGAGIKKYLAPVKADELRTNDYVVGKIELPPDRNMSEIVTLGAIGERTIPDSGLFVAPVARDSKSVKVQLIASDCKMVDQKVIFAKNEAIAFQKFALKPLSKKDAVRFSGTVLLPSGGPAAKAIVRICDWDVTRTNEQGKFKFDSVSPGKFLVRAEYPGGEFHQEIEFAGPKPLKKDLSLTPVTTIGIRWALQTETGSRELSGEGVKTGEAFFSVAHSRFSLERGAIVRSAWGSDFKLVDDVRPYEKLLTPQQKEELQAAGTNSPFFWLFDATGWPSGLHLESESYEYIEEVSGEAVTNARAFFQFLRGQRVQKGQVYTVRCVRKDNYAKLEITDVSPPAR